MKHTTHNKGFTLIETLIAIFILTVAIQATMWATSLGLQASYYARDQITAYYLAEEGMEYIRHIRDTNFLTGGDWLAGGLRDCLTATDTGLCRVDISGVLPVALVSNDDDLKLYYDPTPVDTALPGNYTHIIGSANSVFSKFTRKISIMPISADEVLVTVRVEWQSGSIGTRSVVIKGSLFNWQP